MPFGLVIIVVLFSVPGFMQQADGFIEQMRFARKTTAGGQVHQFVYELLEVLILAGHDFIPKSRSPCHRHHSSLRLAIRLLRPTSARCHHRHNMGNE